MMNTVLRTVDDRRSSPVETSVNHDNSDIFITKGKKVKEVDLYSAFIEVPHTQGTQVGYRSHSVTCKLHRTCLYLVSIHQMAHLHTEVADI